MVLCLLVQDGLIDALQFVYDAHYEGVKTRSFNLVGEIIVDIVL